MLSEWRVRTGDWGVQSVRDRVQSARDRVLPPASYQLALVASHLRFGRGKQVKASSSYLQVTLAEHFINRSNQISLLHFFPLPLRSTPASSIKNKPMSTQPCSMQRDSCATPALSWSE